MSDTTPRDQLAALLADDWNPDRDPILTAMFRDYAQTILAAGWRPPARVVTTMEELDALHDGTLIVDRQGDSGYVWQGAVHYPETAVLPVDYTLKHYGPFKVHYEPEEGE